MKDFFISHTKADKAWAEWIAWTLEEYGYSAVLDAWDFQVGRSFVGDMHKASIESARTIVVLSRGYMHKAFPLSEWAAAFVRDPGGSSGKIVPVRVEDFVVEGLLASLKYIDVVGLDEDTATQAVLNGIDNSRKKPDRKLRFPGNARHSAPKSGRFPGSAGQGVAEVEGKCVSRRLIYAKVPAYGLVDFSNLSNPYDALSDPTGFPDSHNRPPMVTGFLWLPGTQYLRSSVLEPFTPAAAVCALDPLRLVENLRSHIGTAELHKLLIPPRKLRKEEKHSFITAMGSVLEDCFEVAVTFPELFLRVGHHHPELAHQAMIDSFLLPLMQTHRRLGIENFHLRLYPVGDRGDCLLRNAKRVAKACYPKRGTTSVAFVGNNECGRILTAMARLFAWTVGSFHNSGNRHWISLLEAALE